MSETEMVVRLGVCVLAAGVMVVMHALVVRGGGWSGWRRALLPVAGAALGGAAAFGAARTLGKVPGFRPVLNDEWVFWCVLLSPVAAGLMASAAAGAGGSVLARWGGRATAAALAVGFAALAAWLALGNAVRAGYHVGAPVWAAWGLSVVAIALPWLVAHWGTACAERERAGRWSALAGLVGAGVMIGVLMAGMFYSRYVKHVEIAATAGMAAGVFAVMRLVVVRVPVLTLVVGLSSAMNGVMWLTALGYASAPLWAAVIGVCAPLGLGLELVGWVRRRPVVVRAAIVAAAVGVIGGSAAMIAARENRRPDDLYGRLPEARVPIGAVAAVQMSQASR